MSIFALPRSASEPAAATHPRCVVFKWIGQSWESCNGCGRPLEQHLYDPPYGGAPTLFHVKEYSVHLGWYWSPVGSVIRRPAQDGAA